MSERIAYPPTPFPLPKAMILLGRRGSEAHGLRLPDAALNDRDLMGVVVPPVGYYLGLRSWEVAEAQRDGWDTVLYEVRKFVRLLMKQNPNVLDLLWVEDEDILSRSVEGLVLVENRDLFRHEGYARDAFLGYAQGQFQKMEAFDKPTMERITALEDELRSRGIDPDTIV